MTDLDLDAIERRTRGYGATRDEVAALVAEVRRAHEALRAVKGLGERWAGYVHGGRYPEASAYEDAIRGCGAELVEAVEEVARPVTGTTVNLDKVKASILTIKPGDILVISVPKDTTQQQAHDIRKAAQAELDAHNVNAPVLIVTFDTDPKIGRLVNSSDPVTGTVPNVDVPGSETP